MSMPSTAAAAIFKVVLVSPNEPVLTSLRVQGNFQADSGTPNSLIGFPKPNSTKTLKYYEIINK
jgi:hypothetical protein